ncbi:hypothetical protein TYRP_005414 [Tyrophagus putrescentiae]|nr:hypothetical protein TYRP_005414 [Tyrophagus putrescentiae]
MIASGSGILLKKLTSQLEFTSSHVVRIYYYNVVCIFRRTSPPSYNVSRRSVLYHQLLQAYTALFFFRMLLTSTSLFADSRLYFRLDISLAMVERQGFFDRISFLCAAFPAILAIYIDRVLYGQPDPLIWSNIYYLVVKNCDQLFGSSQSGKSDFQRDSFWGKLFRICPSRPARMLELIENNLKVNQAIKNQLTYRLLEQRASCNEIKYLYRYIYWVSPRIRAKIVALIVYLDLFLGFAFCFFALVYLLLIIHYSRLIYAEYNLLFLIFFLLDFYLFALIIWKTVQSCFLVAFTIIVVCFTTAYIAGHLTGLLVEAINVHLKMTTADQRLQSFLLYMQKSSLIWRFNFYLRQMNRLIAFIDRLNRRLISKGFFLFIIWIDYSWSAFFAAILGITAVMTTFSSVLHRGKRSIDLLQLAVLKRGFLYYKLKFLVQFERLNSERKIGFSTGPLGIVTQKAIFEFIVLYALYIMSISPVARLVEEEARDGKAEHQPQHIAVVNEGDDDEEEGAQDADDALFLTFSSSNNSTHHLSPGNRILQRLNMRQLRHRGDRPNVDNDLQRHLGEDRKSQLILHLHVGGMFLLRRIQPRHLGQLPGTLVEVGEADADGNHEDAGPSR